jgi:thiol-disulfide isomerase/thioredoxin
MKKANKTLVLGFLLACLGTAVPGYPAGAEAIQAELDSFRLTIREGDELFPFGNLVTTEGEPFDGLELKNKYALVTLWSTWCSYCDKENPSLQAFYEKYGNESFTVMTITRGDDEGPVLGYMEREG